MRYEVGDLVEHTNTRLRARVQKVMNRTDGTQDLTVFTDVLWNSAKVNFVKETPAGKNNILKRGLR